MKWKILFILISLTFLVSSEVSKVSARPNHSSVKRNTAKSARRWNPSALHGATHLSPTLHKSTMPSSTLRSGSVITDDEGINLKQKEYFRWNMDAKDMNIGKFLTVRKFAMRRTAKRHKAVLPPYTTGMSSSASPLKEAFVFQTLRPTFVTDVPAEKKIKSPAVLTILPTDDRNILGNMFSPPADKAGTESEQNKSTEEGDTNEDYSAHDKPRVTEHDRLSRSGTESKPLKTGTYYEITPSGLRWITAHDSRTGAEHKRQKRYDHSDKNGPGQAGSPIILAAVFGGIFVLLCIFNGLARLCKICKKKCLRRKDPDSTYVEVKVTRISTDTPTSTPSMAASTLADSPNTVIKVSDSSSLDTSFTCSSLSDEFPGTTITPKSSPSLTSVSSMELSSEVDTSFVASESDISSQCSSSTSISAMPIKPEKDLVTESLASPTYEPNVFTDASLSAPSFLLTIEPDVSTTYVPSQPATPNVIPSASDESTGTTSKTAESGASCREACKTPVAPKDEVVITIKDEEDEVSIYNRETSQTELSVVSLSGVTNEDDDGVTAINVSGATTENVDDVTKSLENVVEVNVSGLTVEGKDSCVITVE